MTELAATTEILGKILNGNAVGFFLMAFAVIFLFRELRKCQDSHLDCERKTTLLASAIIDHLDGNGEQDARAKAESIVQSAKG